MLTFHGVPCAPHCIFMLEKRGKEPGLHGPWEFFIDGLQSIQKLLEIGRQVRGAYLRVLFFFWEGIYNFHHILEYLRNPSKETSTNPVLPYAQIGDRVMAFVNYNAWAEVVCTPVEFVYKIPDDMSFSEAAAFPMNFVTAYMMLFEVANLREGMSVLVHSAGGGVVSWLLMRPHLQAHDGAIE